MLTSFVRVIYCGGQKIKLEIQYFIVKLRLMFAKNWIFNDEMCKTDHIPRSVALADPCGVIKSILCMCAICMYCALAQALGN